MGNITQDIVLVGGLNSDDDLRLLPEGDYRHAENIRFATSETNNIGAFESIFGNEIVSNFELRNIRTFESSIVIPNTATHTCIGSCIDITTDCVYFAVHTSPFKKIISEIEYEYVQDAIYEYNKNTGALATLLKDGHETNTDTTVFYDKFLNFSLDHPMNGMFVVDGMLFFNDGYNPPRKIKIERAKNFTKSINQRLPFTTNIHEGLNVGFIVTQAAYNSLTVGDRIQIFQNRGATYSYYDGTAIIINKVIDSGNYVVVINKSFLGNTTPEGGYIYKSYGGYSIPFKEAFMDRIKYPPIFPIDASIGNDSTKNFNYIADSQFQFAYKYIYNDNEESTLSPISEIPLLVVDVINDSFSYNEPKINNVIYLTLNTGNNDVKGIKIYARSTSETNDSNPVRINCNNSDWWLIDEILKYDDSSNLIIDDESSYVYPFYNTQNKQYGDQTDLNRPFDYVPQICGTSEIVENSRIVDGDIVEGYNNTKINGILEYDVYNYIYTENYTSDVTLNTYTGTNPINSADKWRHHYKQISIPTTVEVGDLFRFYITKNTVTSHFNNDSFSITITPFMKDNHPLELKKAILNQLNIRNIIGWKEYNYGTPYYSMLFNYCIISNLPPSQSHQDFIQKNSWDSTIVGMQSLSTSYQRYIGYYDKLNTLTNATITDFTTNAPYDDYKIYLTTIYRAKDIAQFPSYREPYELILIDTVLQKTTSSNNFDLNKPLKSLKTNSITDIGIVYFDKANRCGFVNKIGSLAIPAYKDLKDIDGSYITKNDIVIYPKITINSIPPSWATHYAIAYCPFVNYNYFLQYYTNQFLSETNAEGQVLTKISFSYINSINAKKNKTIIEPYIYQNGDRLRVITKNDGKTLITSTAVDAEIVKANSDFVWVEGNIIDGINITNTQSQEGTGWLYEIYRPSKTNKENLYYITPYVFDCSNGYHFGNTQMQDNLLPAILSLEFGDIYRVYSPLSVYGWLERSDAYYGYKSDGLDIGRPNIVNVNAKQQHLYNHIRFSGRLFTDTQINNICRNDASDIIELSSKFGAITKLTEVGYVLKALQERNLTSIYIGRTQLTNADGSTNLSAVNTPLGTINPSESLYGTKYHKSVIRNNRSLYFLDTIQGAFIKDDNNGPAQISEQYKMNYFFTSLCKKIESGVYNVQMTSSYDIRHEEALLSVSLVSSTEGVTSEYYTIAYSEIRNRFITFYTYYPEHLEDLGQQLFAFKNGELWLQNHTTDYNKFFGTVFPQKVTLVANKMPKNNKVFTNNAIRTTGEWSITEIRVPATLNYASGMKSRLKKNKFVNKEGVQYAPFMNDMTDPNYSTVTEALINGRPLRGECIEIDYYNDSIKQSVTLMFSIGMTISEHN